MEPNLKGKGILVQGLWDSVNGACGDLASVPGLVHRIIETGAWQERVHRGKLYRNDSFLAFITTKPMQGCGWPPEKVEALLRDDAVILAEWRAATTAPKHIHADTCNTSIRPVYGRAYLLGRLKRERRDLFERVARKELSTHAAATEAGFRKKLSALEQIRKLLPRLTPEELHIFEGEGQSAIESASDVIRRLKLLTGELTERRVKHDLDIKARGWTPDLLNKKHLLDILDWIEDQLKLLAAHSLLPDDSYKTRRSHQLRHGGGAGPAGATKEEPKR
jgi:hypothetical protein